MKRTHLFEFIDLSWYPKLFRDLETDFLQYLATLDSDLELIPLIKRTLENVQTSEIVDLCSGGTGPWIKLQKCLIEAGYPVNIKLTDKFPNPEVLKEWQNGGKMRMEYLSDSIDATEVPASLKGMRTLFAGFHHFEPEDAQAILRDAAEKNVAIGIFERSSQPHVSKLFILLLTPLMIILAYFKMTPYIKPLKFSRIFWTYLVPVVPLISGWDALVSLIRVYSPEELKEMTERIETENYKWEIGRILIGNPVMDYIYLLGYPIINQENTDGISAEGGM